MFSYLNRRLDRLGINYDIVLSNCKKRHTNELILLSVVLIASIVTFIFYKSPWLIVCSILLIVRLVFVVYTLSQLIKIEPFTDKANEIVVNELNNVYVMKNLLKNEDKNFSIEELTNIKVTDIEDFEMKSIRKFIFDTKFRKEYIFTLVVAYIIGVVISNNYHMVADSFINQVILILISIVGVLCVISVLVGLGVPINKIVYRGFLDKLTAYYETGIISGEQYKASILYFSDCTLEGVFTEEEYEYLISNDLVYNYDIVVKYIKSCNIKRILGLVSLGIILAFGLYFIKPIYALFGIIPVLLSALFIRVNDKAQNLERYEHKLLKHPEKLTALIMQELPQEFLADL